MITIGLQRKGDSGALRTVPGTGRALRGSEAALPCAAPADEIRVPGREYCPASGQTVERPEEFLRSVCIRELAGGGVGPRAPAFQWAVPSSGRLAGQPEAPAGRKLQRPVEQDSSGPRVPDGPLTSGESILREGCWRYGPSRKGSVSNLLRLHFSPTSASALRRLPRWQEMLLTKRNGHCVPQRVRGRGICLQIRSSLLLSCLLPCLSALPSTYKYSRLPLIIHSKREQNTGTLTTPSSSSSCLISFLPFPVENLPSTSQLTAIWRLPSC